ALIFVLRDAKKEETRLLITEQTSQFQEKRPDFLPNHGVIPTLKERTSQATFEDEQQRQDVEKEDPKICNVQRRPQLLAVEPSERLGPDETPRGGTIVPGRYVL